MRAVGYIAQAEGIEGALFCGEEVAACTVALDSPGLLVAGDRRGRSRFCVRLCSVWLRVAGGRWGRASLVGGVVFGLDGFKAYLSPRPISPSGAVIVFALKVEGAVLIYEEHKPVGAFTIARAGGGAVVFNGATASDNAWS